MKRVAIIGIGQTPVREHWDRSLRELAVDALWQALDDAQRNEIDGLYVGNMLGGVLSEQEHLGALIADFAGFAGIEAVKVEGACASGAAAFRQGVLAIASGQKKCVAVVGVEKLTEHAGWHSTGALATAADADFETSLGLTFVALNALIKQRFMFEHKLTKEPFAHFPVLAHHNAQYNPHAMFRQPISVEQYLKAKMIAEPINLLDSSPIADGAAAVILAPLDELQKNDRRLVEVLACEVGTDSVALHDRKNLLMLQGVQMSAQRAFKTAGLTPREISFFEPHDAFSIMTALSIEASGFMIATEALKHADNGYFAIDGRLPICTMGGLKGRGHPVGATGIYQVVEATMQLRGEAPSAIQVARPRYGMTQNIGGTGATVVTTILKGKS
ncbi:thiolase family protein [Caldithrix abyssi DSM 13497]|uniref:Thiolase family protein n=1 Tax=Caldithrix abyssi DSM 13497 TaxID=880073 RepID=H1XWT6_CALAY|nr:thiolase domain-containing protein [Caldithrix abyssi]EHO43062.1 thiolase family protein [Caldithrix abyssi DSM 13497]